MKEYKIDVLGTEYTVSLRTKEEDESLDGGCDGYFDNTVKLIVVKVDEDDYEEPKPMALRKVSEFRKKVLRHEIAHAFIYESGLDSQCQWAESEELVDWIAIQVKKMSKAMADAERKFDSAE